MKSANNNSDILIFSFCVIICVSGLILGVFSYIKPDKTYYRLSDGSVDPNAIEIRDYFQSDIGKKFIIDYISSLDNVLRPSISYNINLQQADSTYLNNKFILSIGGELNDGTIYSVMGKASSNPLPGQCHSSPTSNCSNPSFRITTNM